MKICLSGLGRTGIQIARYLLNSNNHKLVSAICSPNSAKADKDIGEVIGCGKQNIPIYSSDLIEQCVFKTKPDVIIDFSTPAAVLHNIETFGKLGLNVVVGTTGFTRIQEKKMFAAAKKHNIGIIYAPNITKGVNTLMLLAELASKILNNYDIEIIEMHHSKKLDVPSGTANKLAEYLSELKSNNYDIDNNNIPISSVRAGGIVGSHKVMLVGENDMIEISHQSFSRDAFAEGAIFAAEFISGKTGVFEMRDALSSNYKNRNLPEYNEFEMRKVSN